MTIKDYSNAGADDINLGKLHFKMMHFDNEQYYY